MNIKIKKLVLKKNNGSMTSFFIGTFYMMLLLILMILGVRIAMLSESLYYIDDSMTAAVLAGATANEVEYGRSNQIILQSPDNGGYVDAIDNGKSGWEDIEADILLSEVNYNSNIIMNYTDLPMKRVKDSDSRVIAKRDEQTLKSLESILNVLHTNLTNGNIDGLLDKTDTDYFTYTSGGAITSSKLLDALNISTDELIYTDSSGNTCRSAISEYVISDIEVSRLQIYNVYRQTFADRHVYASEYMKYQVRNGNTIIATDLTYEMLDNNIDASGNTLVDGVVNILNDTDYVIWISWVGPTTETEFSTQYSSLSAYEYNLALEKWKSDNTFWTTYVNESYNNYINTDTTEKLICFTDTGITYQQSYNDKSDILDNEIYTYMFPMGKTYTTGDDTIKHLDSFYKVSECTATNGDGKLRSKIEGCNVYGYVLNANSNSSNGKYIELNGEKDYLILGDLNSNGSVDDYSLSTSDLHYKSKVAGGKVYNTSIYLELKFTLTTFPSVNNLFSFGDMGTQEVTVGRIVDIDPYYEEE